MLLNVGISKKQGLAAFSSVGASCHVEVELDSALLEGDLSGFHARVRDAYVACQQAVYDELARLQSQETTAAAVPRSLENGHDRHVPAEDGRGYPERAAARAQEAPPGSGVGGGHSARPATASQVRAILAIARVQHIDLGTLLREDYGVTRPEDLSLAQASAFIDQLRAVVNT